MTLRAVLSRVLTWPVFLALAVFHLAVLPFVLSEEEDDVLSVIAGVVYLVFAAVDFAVRRRDRDAVAARPEG